MESASKHDVLGRHTAYSGRRIEVLSNQVVENCVTIGLRLARLRCVGFSKSQTVPVKSDAKSLGINLMNTIHQVHARSSEYPGKERTITWKNIGQNSSSAKCSRCEIWGQISRRVWKTKAMFSKQDLDSCQKHIQAESEGQDYILLVCGRAGTPGCVNKKARGHRVCGRFRSDYAFGQQAAP